MKKNILLFSCIIVFETTIHAQSPKPFSRWSGEIGYLQSSNASNSKNSKPQFASNGINTSIGFRYGKELGINFTAGLVTGKTNDANFASFGKTFETGVFKIQSIWIGK